MKCTFYQNVKDVQNGSDKDVLFVLDRIRSGKSKDIIEKLRSLTNEQDQKNIKLQLKGACFNGTFKRRSIDGCKEHSGLCILDFDGFDSFEQAEEYKNKLKEDKYVFSVWISPRGKGIKVLVKIPAEKDNHKRYFMALKKHFNSPNFDDSSQDISRICYESYDSDLYLNQVSTLWIECEKQEVSDIGTIKPTLSLKSDSAIIRNLITWFDKNYSVTKGSRNANLHKLASAFNDFGVDISECKNHMKFFECKDFTSAEITGLINSAYNRKEQFGTRFFEDRESKMKIEKMIRSGKKKKDIIKSFDKFKESEIDETIDEVKDSIEIENFWKFDDKGRFNLIPHKYKFWLQQNNFFKYYPSSNGTYSFIKREQNLLEEINVDRIKDYVLNWLENNENLGYLPYDSMASSSKYFSEDFLSLLDSLQMEIKKDTKDTCYLYYKNTVVEITIDKINLIDFVDIDGHIWKRQVINRDYTHCDHHQAKFREFIWKISGDRVEKYNTLKSVIGYLCHSYKTSAKNVAIILNDSEISDNPNGGSGKGLLTQSIGRLKKLAVIDGKQFSNKHGFPYQTVSTDTQVLAFDDVEKNFNFESLFSLITEGITLEYKNQPAVKIPVEDSPKILISTNYTIGGDGGSFDRRKFEVELSNFFNSKNTPYDYFGSLLFNDWDNEEYSRFDSFMIQCIQYYLKNGLVDSQFDNLEYRKLIRQCGMETIEWFESDDNIRFDERIERTSLFEKFIRDCPDYKKYSRKWFKTRLQAYCDYKGYNYSEGRSSIERYIYITNPLEQKETVNIEKNDVQIEIPF